MNDLYDIVYRMSLGEWAALAFSLVTVLVLLWVNTDRAGR
jgi:hypothetical protein